MHENEEKNMPSFPNDVKVFTRMLSNLIFRGHVSQHILVDRFVDAYEYDTRYVSVCA